MSAEVNQVLLPLLTLEELLERFRFSLVQFLSATQADHYLNAQNYRADSRACLSELRKRPEGEWWHLLSTLDSSAESDERGYYDAVERLAYIWARIHFDPPQL